MKDKRHLQAIVGLGLIFGLSTLEYLIKKTGVGQQLRSGTYVVASSLQHAIADGLQPRHSDLTIIDISNLPLVPDSVSATPYTSPAALASLIRSITRQHKPTSIGVDIDLSPIILSDGAHVPPGFEELMTTATDLRARNVPVYFGVDRSVGLGPQFWLKDEVWAQHAAWLRIPLQKEYMIPLRLDHPQWTIGEKKVALPGLAAAVAADARGPQAEGKESSPRFAPFEEHLPLNNSISAAMALSDLNWIRFVHGAAIPCSRDGVIATELMDQDRFHNKMVLIARVTGADDQLQPPGFVQPLAGVYLHAAGALTLAGQPLRVFSAKWGMGIGLTVMLVGWIIHTVHRYRHAHQDPAAEMLSIYRTNLIWAAAALLIFLVFLVQHVLWLELMLVLVFVALHTLAEGYIASNFARDRVQPHEAIGPTTSSPHP